MNTETILEFDKIKEKWGLLALTQGAKEKIARTQICLSEVELTLQQRETAEARIMLEKEGTPPLVSLEGVEVLLHIAERGDCLTPAQLEQIELSLTAVKRLKGYLNHCKLLQLSLPYYEENLDELSEIREAIQVQIRSGQVDDYASKLLHNLRSDIQRTRERMKEKADAVMRSNKECMSDSFSVTRNGRICVPVKKEYKFRILGSVIDKSSTGATLFIEPTQVAKYNEELQLLLIDEENEERRILYTLSAMVAEAKAVMLQNLRTMEKLDFAFSKGKLSLDMKAVVPTINTDRRILLRGARHPLMDREVAVPQNFGIGQEYRGIVITGPNTGGKTVAIKTVALNCMMAQCGLHVTCDEADICMNSNYLCDIGDGQNLSENLSTFSAHITNVLEILRSIGPESLVIMDELGSGTDPTEGMGIAVAILEELRKSGCLFLVTTHYPEVKEYAEAAEGLINAKMTFDRMSLRPTYQMVIGEAGESCAFYIAARLGMPEGMLATAARAAYGTGAEVRGQSFGKIPEGSVPKAEQQYREESERCRSSESNRWNFLEELEDQKLPAQSGGTKIQKKQTPTHKKNLSEKFHLGDSVMVYPDKKIGIVCEPVNEKGGLRVQLQNKKIWINHKRVKLHVAAEELYPADYDFSIIFDSVENRKLRHQMERKHVEDMLIVTEE